MRLDERKALALLQTLYGSRASEVLGALKRRLVRVQAADDRGRLQVRPLDQADAMLITYGDQFRCPGEAPLHTLRRFVERWLGGAIRAIHLLPHYPSSSDDGFSVIDYRAVDPALGAWDDVEALAEGYALMFDAVINHVSTKSAWFAAYLARRLPERGYFIEDDGAWDVSRVIRPRNSPLFTEVHAQDGSRRVWTTFSADQVDLDYRNPALLLEMIDLLLFYAAKGARFLRLDAVGFLWKRSATNCLHLPETHAVVKLLRLILSACAPQTRIITETNVPHEENVAYFGDGGDEAHLVYNFSLAPLTADALLKGEATALSRWVATLSSPSDQTTFFNFLASHDGIGLRPAEGLLDDEAIAALVRRCRRGGGEVSYRSAAGEEERPYELNTTLFDLLAISGDPSASLRRFVAAHAIMLSLRGLPGIYLHSFLGSSNWREGFAETGAPRRLNRQKLDLEAVEAELSLPGSRAATVLAAIKGLLKIRQTLPALSPAASQAVLDLHPAILALERRSTGQRLLALTNVSAERVTLKLDGRVATDVLSDEQLCCTNITLDPYRSRWLVG